MGETRFSTVYLTLKSVQDIYPELREKLETRERVGGDKYATTNLVGLWFEKLKRHRQPSPMTLLSKPLCARDMPSI
ncbi:unnamed protein product [Arctogadus glacialis]